MESGERYCLLVNSFSGTPLFYPNLFVTTQVRNKSLSNSAMEAALSGISVLLRYMDARGEILEDRFCKEIYFQDFELDAIRDYCQRKFRKRGVVRNGSKILILPGQDIKNEKVSAETEYVRLTVIAQYIKWLADQTKGLTKDRTKAHQIGVMEKGLKARRPIKKNRNTVKEEKGLTKEQLEVLFEVFRPESECNPFADQSVRKRNRLIFLMLYHLGIRGGELLNIRIRDIDFGRNQLIVARRADQKDDPRKYQPLVKTMDRRMPVKDSLMKELHQYIAYDRRNVPNSRKNDFLFVTHKSGPTQGLPLSKSGYKKIVGIVRGVSPVLFNLTGHQLRHVWNELFSEYMDTMDDAPSHEQQEKIRSYLMGWKEGSGTAETYNKRFIRIKATEAALELQKGMISLPRKV